MSARRVVRRAIARRGAAAPPLLSVVVAMRDVEAYLRDCLESLVGQSYPRVQIIVVDDGSTDGSAAIAAEVAGRDPRVTLLRSPRPGLAAARNHGLAHATGKYVAFVDADDEVTGGSFERLVEALESSGSDLVVGATQSWVHGRWVHSEWSKRSNPVRRLATTLTDSPAVAANWLLGDKVFRRSFLRKQGRRLFSDRRFSDIGTVVRLMAAADALDVIPAAVYRSRVREDGSSLRNETLTDRAALEDFLDGLRDAREALTGSGHAAANDSFLIEAYFPIVADLVRAAMAADDGYWRSLSERLRLVLGRTSREVVDRLPAESRLLAWLCSHDHRDATEAFFDFTVDNPRGYDFRVEPDGNYLSVPAIEDNLPDLDRSLLRLADVDMVLRLRLLSFSWLSPSTFRIGGAGFIEYLDARCGPADIDVVLRERRSGAETVFGTTALEGVDVDRWAARDHEDHDDAAFSADVDMRRVLRDARAENSRSTWEVRVRVRVGGVERTGLLHSREKRGSASLLRASVDKTMTLWPTWNGIPGLVIQAFPGAVSLVAAAPTPTGVDVEIVTSRPASGRRLGFSTGAMELVSTPLEPSGPDRWRGTLPLPASPPAPGTAQPLMVHGAGSRPSPVWWATRDAPVFHRASGVALAADPHTGQSVVLLGADRPSVDAVRHDGHRVGLEGAALTLEEFAVALVGPRTRTCWRNATVRDGRFTVELPLSQDEWGYGENPLPTDRYGVVCRRTDGSEIPVGVDVALHAGLPRRSEADGLRVELGGSRDGELSLKVEPVETILGGVRGQRLLRQRVYAPAREAPLLPAVLFECFAGESGGDNPRAICEELVRTGTDLDVVWSVVDRSVPVPTGSRRVIRWSREWFELLGRAQYLVSNAMLPHYFRKRAGQVYLQTWHGTPLKRIAHDRPHPDFDNWRYLRRLGLETSEWDYLLSPCPFTTRALRNAFRFDGPVLETGYPRNDVLLSEAAGKTRRRTRERLGIADDATVVLYAPTWRENARSGRAYRKVLYLDTDTLMERMPGAVVLVRGHYNSMRTPEHGADSRRVRDVTRYPDIADLYLAADALVTDYSSVMFDFALTDKPMVFLCPDLEYYRDYMRGFYFDFESTAPGPIVEDTDAVVEALDGPDRFAARRARFREDFAVHEDGRAAHRVVRAVLARD